MLGWPLDGQEVPFEVGTHAQVAFICREPVYPQHGTLPGAVALSSVGSLEGLLQPPAWPLTRSGAGGLPCGGLCVSCSVEASPPALLDFKYHCPHPALFSRPQLGSQAAGQALTVPGGASASAVHVMAGTPAVGGLRHDAPPFFSASDSQAQAKQPLGAASSACRCPAVLGSGAHLRGLGVLKPGLLWGLVYSSSPQEVPVRTFLQRICHRKDVPVASFPGEVIEELAGYQD